MDTYICVKAKYTKTGIRELVRIIYNPYKRPAKDIMKEWISLEFQSQCYAINQK